MHEKARADIVSQFAPIVSNQVPFRVSFHIPEALKALRHQFCQ